MTDRASKRRQKRAARKTKDILPKVNGRTVRNKSEYVCFQKLGEIAPPGTRIHYESEKIPYSILGDYLIDFTIEVPKKHGGKTFYIEFKGGGRAWDHKVRQKMIAARDQNPDKDIKIVFYADGQFGAKRKDGSRMRQSDWAKKHNFDFCIGADNIPKEWFD